MSQESKDHRREPYTTPELTRHGSLDELTHGSGTKEVEKGSVPTN